MKAEKVENKKGEQKPIQAEQPKPVQINPSITPGNYVIQVISTDNRLIESQVVTNSKVVIYPVGSMSLISKMELK